MSLVRQSVVALQNSVLAGRAGARVAIVVMLVVWERLRPWHDDLGADVDGNRAEQMAQPRSRLAPAE